MRTNEQGKLRESAEAQFLHAPKPKPKPRPVKELLHELQVHQIELEMQNDELRRTQIALTESRDRYVGLYELAPVGYLTLTSTGQISQINLTGAALLGVERRKILMCRFAGFVTAGDSDRWRHHFLNVLQRDERQSCELVLQRGDGSHFHARLDCLHMKDGGISSVRITLSDITESKRAEEERRIAAIAFESHEGMMVTDANGVILRVNRAFTQMTGYSEEEAVGKTPAMLKSGRQDKAFYQQMWATLKREHYWQGELWNKHKDGRLYAEQLTISAVIAPDRSITHYIGAYFDMTARKLAEAALLKAEVLQSAIFNSANFSIIATDAKGIIQIFNVGAEHMLGYSAADVVNKITPADIVDPQETISRAKALSSDLGTTIAPGFEAMVFKASRGIEDVYELTYIRNDGSRLPAVESVTALRNTHGEIIGYLLIGTDNTERKQIEEEKMRLDQRLRDQQFYTRSLFDSNIDALVTTNPSGIITDVNKQMEKLTGCARIELIGASFKNHFTDPERAEAAIKLVLKKRKISNYELTVRNRAGKEVVVSYNATTFYDRDRRLQGVFAAARDITERKQLDQELENARSLAEKANLAKSDFLSRMSHELRTPLNAILGFAQLLETGSPPPTSAQIVRLHQITKAGWYLLDLINEILNLAVIESGKLSLSREPVSLDELLRECQTMIEPQAQTSGIHINFLPFDPAWFVNADRTRLKQVLINLISNAIKYNREPGKVEVECGESTPERIRISIKDSGAGLPPEKLAQLFQPFNRLGQEEGIEEGTGIGLVVTKQLVELMGGAIGVESTVGVGSVFWIELIRDAMPQIVSENALPEKLVPQAYGSAAPHSLLYVEDNSANLMLVEQIIAEHTNVRMLSARDGDLGIKLARAQLPDIILMDINLPGISGIEVMKTLRSDPATAHIPVVALSADAMPHDIEKGLEAGFFSYLTKPINVNEFMNVLDEVLKFSETGLGDANKLDKHVD